MSPLREQRAVWLKEKAIRESLGEETEDAPRIFGGESPMTLESESYRAPMRLDPESYTGDPVSGVEFAPLEDLFVSSEDDLLLAALDR
jgi:hypothetical protein